MVLATLEYNEQMFRFLFFSIFNISGFHCKVICMLCAYCASKAIKFIRPFSYGINFSLFFFSFGLMAAFCATAAAAAAHTEHINEPKIIDTEATNTMTGQFFVFITNAQLMRK